MTTLFDTNIERESMRRRPLISNAGTQKWRDLLFLHWEIPFDLANSLLPKGLFLDSYNGKAWVGLVPFAMEGVRPWWIPSWAAFTFLETNIRLYVHHNGEAGVYFLSLDAASWLAVQAARIGWGLPYHYAQMHVQQKEERFLYSVHRSRSVSLNLDYTLQEALPESHPDSLEFFFLERYLLFVEHHGQILRGQVYHTPYPVYKATLNSIEETMLHSHGIICTQGPTYIHASPGVDVEVFPLTRT